MATQTTENTAGTHEHNFNKADPERPDIRVCSCGLDNEQYRLQEEAKNAPAAPVADPEGDVA